VSVLSELSGRHGELSRRCADYPELLREQVRRSEVEQPWEELALGEIPGRAE
jgi:hypothetical protein